MESTQPRRALRKNAVLEKTGLSNSTLYRLIKAGAFPKPFPLSERTCAWDEAAVDQWLAEKFKAAA